MAICGTPDEEFMRKITSVDAQRYVLALPKSPRMDFNKLELFSGINPEGKIDFSEFISKCISPIIMALFSLHHSH